MQLDSAFDDAVFVLADAYQGETWGQLGKSGYEPNQGFFHDEAFIRACAASPGFVSYEGYLTAIEDFEAGADARTRQAFKTALNLDIPEEMAWTVAAYYEAVAQGDTPELARLRTKYPVLNAWTPGDLELEADWAGQFLSVLKTLADADASALVGLHSRKVEDASTETPLPCPCCGGQPVYSVGDASVRQPDMVLCVVCDLTMEGDFVPGTALVKWNKRI